MSVKVIEARYPGVCGRCEAEVKPGDRINYGGPGAISCADKCKPIEAAPAQRSGGRGGRGRSGRRPLPALPRGKCEDAPCCGCCGVWD